MKRLERIVSDEDFKFYQSFFEHFLPQMRGYLEESKAFSASIKEMNESFTKPNAINVMNSAFQFYSLTQPVNYTILFTWWPPINRDNASPTGNFLVLRKNPQEHLRWSSEDIAFHEVIHSISTLQDLDNKRAFTNLFLSKCSIQGKMKRYKILEEPLAVAIGQMYFLEKTDPEKYQQELKSDSWYRNKWINEFSKLIYPSVKMYLEQRKPIDMFLINQLADICVSESDKILKN